MRPESVATLTLDQAYQAAYSWMFHVGEPPVEITERGAQSVELRSEGMAAFVRVPDRPLNQRTVLAVLATEPDHRIRLIFSTTGFTPGAISIAEAQGIALFLFDTEGSALPANGRGAAIAPADKPPAPFPKRTAADEIKTTKANWGHTDFPENEWIDCPGCGTNQHMTLNVCRICGVALGEAGTGSVGEGDTTYECLDCGSHNVQAVPARDTAHHT